MVTQHSRVLVHGIPGIFAWDNRGLCSRFLICHLLHLALHRAEHAADLGALQTTQAPPSVRNIAFAMISRSLSFLALATAAFGQAGTGELRITIEDPTGLPVPARAELVSRANQYSHKFDAAADGQ